MIHERTLQSEAADALQFVASAMRYQPDLVRFAVGAGIPKRQISRITGLARTTIDRMASEQPTFSHPCDYCLPEHFRQLRRGDQARPIADSHGYLIYRILHIPEIVAQKLCDEHRDEQWEQLSNMSSARYIWCPHMENTPSQIVYSLGSVRDDTGTFRDFFGRFPQWQQIAELLEPEVHPEDLLRHDSAAHQLAHDLAPGESARWADLVNTAASMADLEESER